MKLKVLFLDTVHPYLQMNLEQMGFVCTDGSDWILDEILNEVSSYSGIVIRSRFKIDASFLENCKSLRFIARAGAGMENIDLKVATSKNIVCINAPEGNRNAVAEHALGMLLALLNNLLVADKQVREGKWMREQNRGVEIDGKTIGIIGFGNTGSAFAKKLGGFDCEILVHDPYVKINIRKENNLQQVGLDEIFRQCDVVSLHVPLTDETFQMVNAKFIDAFSKPVYLINTSRGKVVNTIDLITGLDEGKLAGAALDVLDFESLSFESLQSESHPQYFNKLIGYDNVILSPHIAGWTVESHKKISEVLIMKIKKISPFHL